MNDTEPARARQILDWLSPFAFCMLGMREASRQSSVPMIPYTRTQHLIVHFVSFAYLVTAFMMVYMPSKAGTLGVNFLSGMLFCITFGFAMFHVLIQTLPQLMTAGKKRTLGYVRIAFLMAIGLIRALLVESFDTKWSSWVVHGMVLLSGILLIVLFIEPFQANIDEIRRVTPELVLEDMTRRTDWTIFRENLTQQK